MPSGMVFFSPDTSKGGQGPQGFAPINDGKYDTRSARAKGCSTGAQRVSIQGADGKDIRPGHPYGSALFQTYVVEIDVPAEGGEINFIVPDSIGVDQAPEVEPE